MSKFAKFWDECGSEGRAGLIIISLFIGFFAVVQARNIFDPGTRCANAHEERQRATQNEISERTHALAGERASAEIAVNDAMERSANAVSKVNRECKK